MQATVSSFDSATAAGTVLLDDGVQLSFGPEALRGGGLLHLRQGQRVHIEAAGTTVRVVSIIAR